MKRRFFLTSLLSAVAAAAAALTGVRRSLAGAAVAATNDSHTRQPGSPGSVAKDAHCVLCGKTREQVRKLIVGAHGSVCLECIALCNDIIQADARQS
jgi:hypothetical protein